MNWKLVRPATGEPEIDDWSGVMPPKIDGPKIDVLEILFGGREDEGVKKLAPGVWEVPSGWV